MHNIKYKIYLCCRCNYHFNHCCHQDLNGGAYLLLCASCSNDFPFVFFILLNSPDNFKHMCKLLYCMLLFIGDSSSIKVLRSFIYPENEYYVIILDQSMHVGKYSLKLNFNANVSKILTGFYKSSYKQNGTERYYQ